MWRDNQRPGKEAEWRETVLLLLESSLSDEVRGVGLVPVAHPQQPAATVALIDALLHVITLNPLWVVTTFIADTVWGLTYYYSKDLTSSGTSHFVWDIIIFIVLPIK